MRMVSQAKLEHRRWSIWTIEAYHFEEDMKQVIRYSHMEKLTQEAVDTFIKKIYVYRYKRESIEWNYRDDVEMSLAKTT